MMFSHLLYLHQFGSQSSKSLDSICSSMLVRSKEECKTVNGSYLMQKDSDAVKEALNQLSEMGWAKKWSSQPYISRRTVSWSDKL